MTDEARRFPDWIPHVLPYVLFLVITYAATKLPGLGPWPYVVRVVAVGTAVIVFWRRGDYPELELRPSLLAIGVGVVGFALWVLPEDLLSFLPRIESTYDPNQGGPGWFWPLFAVRMVGAVLVVPIFEELFIRSFLIRYVDMIEENRDEWKDLPIGRYRLASFLAVVVAMSITHHRWLVAGLWSALVTWLLYREKRMGAVIWAHAVTNLLLGLYVLKTGRWEFW